jgi:hypothetical protein
MGVGTLNLLMCAAAAETAFVSAADKLIFSVVVSPLERAFRGCSGHDTLTSSIVSTLECCACLPHTRAAMHSLIEPHLYSSYSVSTHNSTTGPALSPAVENISKSRTIALTADL